MRAIVTSNKKSFTLIVATIIFVLISTSVFTFAQRTVYDENETNDNADYTVNEETAIEEEIAEQEGNFFMDLLFDADAELDERFSNIKNSFPAPIPEDLPGDAWGDDEKKD